MPLFRESPDGGKLYSAISILEYLNGKKYKEIYKTGKSLNYI